MPIEKVSTILQDADIHGYGVAAFNVFNYETISWVIQSAQEEKMPVIVQFYPGFDRFIPMEVVSAITKKLASKVSVPIGLHLDHSTTFEDAIRGIHCGFPSIMLDGSKLSFEDNIKLTSEVVKSAHAMDVDVEAELGHIGSGENVDDFTDSSHFTDPDDVAVFIERTGADSLAISVGNAHGHYKSTPSLDFNRIKEINKIVSTPLVMHGGSDIPDVQLQKSICCGMNKFNIATEYNRNFFYAVKKHVSKSEGQGYMYRCLNQTEQQVKEFIKTKIRILNPKSYRL